MAGDEHKGRDCILHDQLPHVCRWPDGHMEQGIAGGATHTNHKTVTFADGVSGQKAATEPYPCLQFPVFNTSHPAGIFANPGRAGFTTREGTFRHNIASPGFPKPNVLGLSSGPVVVYDGFENGGSNHALVISPATHFKGATMLRWGDDEWAVGMSGEITEVPVGFTHETIMVVGDAGVTEAMDYFGTLMRTAYKTDKIYDRVVDKLGYWTDVSAHLSSNEFSCALLALFALGLQQPIARARNSCTVAEWRLLLRGCVSPTQP